MQGDTVPGVLVPPDLLASPGFRLLCAMGNSVFHALISAWRTNKCTNQSDLQGKCASDLTAFGKIHLEEEREERGSRHF
jgi:hypothetical protein